LAVNRRIEYANDLYAADAMYHQICSINFRTRRQIPSLKARVVDLDEPDAKKKRGRPIDVQKDLAYL